MKPIETLAEAQRRAKKRLPKDVYNSLVAGTEKGLTTAANIDVFDEVGFHPRVARELPPTRDLTTTVLGIDMSMPVIVSPAGAQAVDPGGEVAVAKAARAAGISMGLSSFASMPFKDVAAANENAFYQLYWVGTREQMTERVERARTDGAKALILTIDWAFASRRDWGSPSIPEKVTLGQIVRFAPQAALKPGWSKRWVLGGIPDLRAPNLASTKGGIPTFKEAYIE